MSWLRQHDFLTFHFFDGSTSACGNEIRFDDDEWTSEGFLPPVFKNEKQKPRDESIHKCSRCERRMRWSQET